jgi:hypothetical protein
MCKVINENLINNIYIYIYIYIYKHDSYVARSKILRQLLVYFEPASISLLRQQGQHVS